MLRLTLAGALAAAGLVLFTPVAAQACSCAIGSFPEQVGLADVVFTGELTEITPPPRRLLRSSGDPATYTFAVDGVHKGRVAGLTQVTSAVSGASCGLEGMQVGTSYVVLANSAGAELSANLCGGTAPVGPGVEREVVELLGPAAVPDPGELRAGSTSDDGSAAGWLVVGLGAVVALGAVGLNQRARRRAADAC